MTNYINGAILLMVMALYFQKELEQALLGRMKSIAGFICLIGAITIIIVGAFVS